jgi:hypothetical protein
MGKILIIKGADFSKNSIGIVEKPDFDYENLKLLLNYYFDNSGNNIIQESSTESKVYGAIIEDYIPVTEQNLTVKTLNFSIIRIAEYDSNKKFIQRQINQQFTDSAVFELSNNTYYIRLSLSKSSADSSYELFIQNFNSKTTSVNNNNLIATSYITEPVE